MGKYEEDFLLHSRLCVIRGMSNALYLLRIKAVRQPSLIEIIKALKDHK